MKRKDWFIAGGLVAIGIILLAAASISMRPMGMNMGMMMVWAMFVPWIILIILFLLVVCFGRLVVSIVIQTLCRHGCPSCGRRIRTDWNVCPNCGLPLQNSKK